MRNGGMSLRKITEALPAPLSTVFSKQLITTLSFYGVSIGLDQSSHVGSFGSPPPGRYQLINIQMGSVRGLLRHPNRALLKPHNYGPVVNN